MANIVLLGRCNLKCPYCFAEDFTSSQSADFDMSSLDEVLNFIAPDGEVGLIGGEPLIYKSIDTVLDILKDDMRFRRVTLFTNGVFIDKHIDSLLFPKLSILINLNSSEDIGKANFDRIDSNIELLCKRGMAQNVTLGINIYKENQSFDEFVSIANKYGFKRVRFSVSIPQDKSCGAIPYFEKMKPTLLRFYEIMKENGIAPCPDCNIIPECVYTPEELAFIDTVPCFSQREEALLLGKASVCSPIIDIYPDLCAARCFGCYDDIKVSIKGFKSISDLRNYFFMWIDSVRVHKPVRETCKDCYKFNTFACYGACICYKK
jgi:sulfatase maturation enzyme AslB (radical SAM superfamily)